MRHYILSYDISDNKLRRRVAICLQQNGAQRVQKSVFLAPRFPQARLKKLQKELEALLKQKALPTDSLYCFPLSGEALAHTQLWGAEQNWKSWEQGDLFWLI